MATDERLGEAIVLFDGVCNFCNGAVHFVIRRDKGGYFRFAPLQEAAGERLQRKYGIDPSQVQTFVVIDQRRAYGRSTAALRIARRLGYPYKLLYPLILIPAPIRDLVYSLLARFRYRLFGQREECMVPTAEVRDRFLTQ